jgi:hypothetical protein
MLTHAYKHKATESKSLVPATIPLDPATGYSHANVDAFGGYSSTDIADVRFYCDTSYHGRVIHFKTSNDVIAGMAFDGNQGNNNVNLWTSSSAYLDGHTAALPAQTTDVYTLSNGGLTEFPFWVGGVYHWGIAGEGTRFECDDFSLNTADTLHQIWVRMSA